MDENTVQIPGWRIIRVIGQGGFGKVYEIEKDDEFGGGMHSALKVVSVPESASEIQAYRDDGYDEASISALFRNRVSDITSEFRLMGKLKGCSNIVSYEDHMIVRHENDPGYDILIRMELLTPLPRYIEQRFGSGPVDEETVRRIGADICRALEICARYNILHRDIKPQNIFVNEIGDFKLGDFGIARTSDHTTRATMTGTYVYMAPEVFLNKPYHRSVDQYSLGMVLYWLLNERRNPFLPLPPEIPKAGQTMEALERRMRGEPLPAPKHGSEQLKQIVLKACAYDPKARYADVTEMKADLECAESPAAARGKTEPERPSAAAECDRTIPAAGVADNDRNNGNNNENKETIRIFSSWKIPEEKKAPVEKEPPVKTPKPEQKRITAAPGSIIKFGRYMQNAYNDEKTDISWFVVRSNGTEALLLSQYALDAQQYHTTTVLSPRSGFTWEHCSLRKWLNTEFLDKAFTQDEKERILLTTYPCGDNELKDRIFLLSGKECCIWLNSTMRKCRPTDYARKNRRLTTDCDWWLRTSMFGDVIKWNHAPYVDRSGNHNNLTYDHVDRKYIGVRPAMWIKL